MEHNVVSPEAWLEARVALLEKEKAFTRARDALTAERLALPWVRIEKAYVFDAPDGRKTLADLFDGRSQLIVQHFMFGPDWEAGCVGCSFGADHVDAAWQHLKHHDVTFVAVARAPIARLEAYRKRMGWHFAFFSSAGSDFNFDFHVSFTKDEVEKGGASYNYTTIKPDIADLPGASAFFRDTDGVIYHTYSNYARGGEEVLGAYMLLDMAPLGRNETTGMMDWVKRHDEYPTRREASAA